MFKFAPSEVPYILLMLVLFFFAIPYLARRQKK
jgi:hypothetical protein